REFPTRFWEILRAAPCYHGRDGPGAWGGCRATPATSARVARGVAGVRVATFPGSGHPAELLERVAPFRREPPAHPPGPRDLGDVDVAAGVDGDAVRRREAAGLARLVAAPARQQPAALVEDADAPALRILGQPMPPRRLPLVPPQFGDVGAALGIEHD